MMNLRVYSRKIQRPRMVLAASTIQMWLPLILSFLFSSLKRLMKRLLHKYSLMSLGSPSSSGRMPLRLTSARAENVSAGAVVVHVASAHHPGRR